MVAPLLRTLVGLHDAGILHRCALRHLLRGAVILLTHSCLRDGTLTWSPSMRECTRDIKPENLFLDVDMNLKLGDLGLAIDGRLEVPTSRVGTLDYMAPEVNPLVVSYGLLA